MKDRLGNTMRAARKASNMTQKQMAQAVGVSHITVSFWENGKSTPSFEALQKWYDALPPIGKGIMRGFVLFVE